MYKVAGGIKDATDVTNWRNTTLQNIEKQYQVTKREFESVLDTVESVIITENVDPSTLSGLFNRLTKLYK